MPVESHGPVCERIAKEVEHRLRKLLAGGSSRVRVLEVVRPKRHESNTPVHMQIVQTQDQPVINAELSHPGNPPATAYDLRFNIRGHVMPSELDRTAVDTFNNYFASDVRKALCNATSWWTWDGLAVNTVFGDVQDIDSDGSFDGFNLPMVVTYRTDEDDPYTVRA